MIKAVFFDVDGTLVSHGAKRVAPSAREAIAKLQAKGIRCVVATGRDYGVFKTLPAGDIPFDGYITLNGQIVRDRDGQLLFGMPITGKTREFLLRAFREHHFPALLIEQDRAYMNYIDEQVEGLQATIGTPILPVEEYTGGEIYQICAYIAERQEEVLAEIWDECVITSWIAGGVDIVEKGGGKVTGIQRYLDLYGIRPEETMAIGDGVNDMQMLQFCGIGIAMGNSLDEVKACADFVTGNADADGISDALKHYQLI